MTRRYNWTIYLGTLGIAVLTWLMVAHGPLRTMENWLSDLRVGLMTARQPPPDDPVIITITEDTLRQFPYRSPLNRVFLAQLITVLSEKGARAIGLDILFDQPTEPAADEALAQVLHHSATPVFVAYADHETLNVQQQAFLEQYTTGMRRGYVNLFLDNADGVARTIFPGRIAPNGQFIPGLAVALAGVTPPPEPLPLRYRGLAPGAPDDQLLSAFKIYPAHLAAMLPTSWLAGRLVLVGADLQETATDVWKTPFSALLGYRKGHLPGVVIHAHAMAQLLQNQPLPVTPPWAVFSLYLVAALLGVAMTRLDWPVWADMGLVIGLISGFGVLTFWWYGQGGGLLPLGGPALALLIAVSGAHAIATRQERRQKRFIQGAFARYLHPDWVKQLVADPNLLRLQGERRELTILFTDVANFTTTSEDLPPATLVWVLSHYLEGMTEIIIAHGGAVNKYLGDGIMVLFGAPVMQEDHARRAVRCALALDQFAEKFRTQATDPDGTPVAFGETRIGVHTGEVTIGNFGSHARLEYTAIGDVANAASRLEGLNKHIGTRIAVSDAARIHAEQQETTDLRFQPIGRIVVKGKSEALQVFHPVAANPASITRVNDYASAYALLDVGDPRAAERFAELQTRYPSDPLVAFHLRRLQAHECNSQVKLTSK